MPADLAVTLAVGGGYLVWQLWRSWRASRSVNIDRQVREAAEELAFGRKGALRHVGRLEGVAMELVQELPHAPEDELPDRGLLRIAASEPLPLPLRLCAEGPATWLGAQDVAFGEQRFDEAVHVRTQDDAIARALLDGPVRDGVLAAVEQGLRFEDGRWSLETVVAAWTPAQIVAATRRVARAQRLFADAMPRLRDVPAALRTVARADRHAGVRARALDLLVQRGIAERELLLDRCRDVDANVRLIAARALGPDGVDTLIEEVRTGSRTVRARAASALAESTQLRADLAIEVEDCLVGALEDEELVRLALLGLTRIGTGRSVEALKRVARSGPSASVRGMARMVLGSVKGRLDPASSGALSIADFEGGELSEASPTSPLGRVSVPEGQERR